MPNRIKGAPALSLALALVVGSLTACTGTVSDLGGDAPEGRSPTSRESPSTPYSGACDMEAAGHSILSRVNQREYAYAVQDLFGIDEVPELRMPTDEANVKGFDNDGAILLLTPDSAERYMNAGEQLAALVTESSNPPLTACRDLAGAELWVCLDEGLGPFFQRAFRRPASADVLDSFREYASEASTFEGALRSLVEFTLSSPYFIFHYRTPLSSDGDAIDVYELVNNLSFLVWSSVPDDTLLTEADALRSGSDIERLVDTMFTDERSARFFQDFSSLWVQAPVLSAPLDNDAGRLLHADMIQESRMFTGHALGSEDGVNEILNGDYSFMTERLAVHYGLEATGLTNDEFREVALPPERRGLMTHGASLLSPEGNSMPIQRGVWASARIACDETPPAPEDIPVPEEVEGGNERDSLEQHTSNPACASCHAYIDPYGFALEHFDGLGRYRETYEGDVSIDTSGELVSGETFDTLPELQQLISDSGAFEQCVAEYVSTYALRRQLTSGDLCMVEEIVEQTREASGVLTARDFVARLAASPLFNLNHGDR